MYQMDILRVSQSAIVRTDNYAVLRYSGVYNGTRRDSLLMFYFSPQKFQNLDSLIRKKTLPSQYVFNVNYICRLCAA